MSDRTAAWIAATISLAFAAAVVFDICVFSNFAAVPFHAAAALILATIAAILLVIGKRGE